jgi:23S rRNA pseudouridine1911/1915/1917 synthase
MTEDTEAIFISEAEAGERLDKILAGRFPNNSRTYFQYLIEQGCVLVNGSPEKKRFRPEEGDEIEVEFILSPELDLSPEPIPLNVIYEDAHLLIINKPPGLVVHPAVGNWSGTFVNALLYHCQNTEMWGKENVRPGIVHRLDKGTSGVLLAAKTPVVQQRLIEMFAARQMEKEYLAICVGNPGSGTLRTGIARDPKDRKKMTVTADGRPAVTHFTTMQTNGKLSAVHINLETGRTHQIRVHMQHRGTPVLGDPLYGNLSTNNHYSAERPLLHAWRLSFVHPMTQEKIRCEAPIPGDIQSRIIKL